MDISMKNVQPEDMIGLANKLKHQLPLLSENGKFSISKLAELMTKEHCIVDYKGLFWKKVGHGLEQLNSTDISTLAISTLMRYNLQDTWDAKNLKTLTNFLSYYSIPINDQVPWHYAFFSNCVVNLRTGKQIPESEIPENMVVTHVMPVKFDPEARCKVLKDGFFKSFDRNQRRAFLSIFGARLTRADNIKTHVILSGIGNQAKGSWRVLIAKIFGKRLCQARVEELHSTFGNKVFVGCDIVWNSETDGKKDTALVIKDITGGTTIKLESKGIDKFGSENVQAMFCEDTNNPSTQTSGEANKTRLEWFKMECQFVKPSVYATMKDKKNVHLLNPNFNITAYTDEELSGFLNMMIPFAKHYLETGEFKFHACKDTDMLTDVSQSIASFLEKFVEFDNRGRVRTKELEKQYVAYCAKIGTQPQHPHTFSEALRHVGGIKGQKHYTDHLTFDKKAFTWFMADGAAMDGEEQ